MRENFGIELCDEILQVLKKYNMVNDYRIFQIKEKFGELRIYGNWGNKELDEVIKKYTDYSRIVCCRCGERAVFYDLHKTMCPICHHCAEELNKQNHLCIELLVPNDLFIEGLKEGKTAKQIYDEYKENMK